jgi:trehalose 6-phosphate synthase/phosphatase
MNARDLGGSEGPLLVVSNRLPFVFQHSDAGLTRRPSPGGLVSALDPVLRKRGGTWLGWPGSEIAAGEHLDLPGDRYRVAPVSLSESDITRYYHGFSNRTLWPLFHSLPARTGFDPRDWEAYQRVNLRFANAALEELEAANLVWIHDYQLMLVPEFVRRETSAGRLGFFLHVPFPCYDIYRVLPWQGELLRGLLACDVVGFHVDSYMRNFMECAERILGARVDRENGVIEYDGHCTRVGSFPIGIDCEDFESKARTSPSSRAPRPERILFGADRLDYTKGIPERIRAVERLLDLHPEYREKVMLLQVAVPSRSQVAEYRALKREIDEAVGRVNGRFATPSWSPIRYIYQALSHERLACFYRDADVALVTPLRDGMNLVAKEFVTCQVDDPGVLVLSNLAGAAETMEEALLVNPHDVDGTAGAIHRALCMGRAERADRMASLRARERLNDVHAWVNGFLAVLS